MCSILLCSTNCILSSVGEGRFGAWPGRLTLPGPPTRSPKQSSGHSAKTRRSAQTGDRASPVAATQIPGQACRGPDGSWGVPRAAAGPAGGPGAQRLTVQAARKCSPQQPAGRSRLCLGCLAPGAATSLPHRLREKTRPPLQGRQVEGQEGLRDKPVGGTPTCGEGTETLRPTPSSLHPQ